MTFHAETIIRKTRKPHRCEYCQSTIPAGSACRKEAGVWEGDFYAGYGHLDCRLELQWQRGDIKQRDRYMALGLEVDHEDCPEVYG